MYYRGIPLYTEYIAGSSGTLTFWSADRKLPSVSILTKCEHATGMYIHTYAYVHASQSTLVHEGTGESASDSCLAGLVSQIPIQRACATGPVYHTDIVCVAERMLDS